MSLGIVMLVHAALHRAEQVARHWSRAGCPVVIHVDRKVGRDAYAAFVIALADLPMVLCLRRYRCEWGTWEIVAASQDASELMIASFSAVQHVYLTSGSCLPLRPVEDLAGYLAARPRTDFIESATTADVPWAVGGLEVERFTLRFPFSWRRNRFLFDRLVELQRRLGYSRRIPQGIVPHMGSQWWCLTRQTLSAILSDPQRPAFDRYFRNVWIPDECYFQTLARRHGETVESRSLTLSKFDGQGNPHTFYDDHLQLLRRSHFFVARKIWPQADRLYDAFLSGGERAAVPHEPNAGKIQRIFSKAVDRRTQGRPGLYMQSRFPANGWERGVTAAKYSVFQGFSELSEDFESWLARATPAQVHGHIFGPDRAEFAGGQATINGALSDSASLRDYDPKSFLTNLLWNTRGEWQCFQYGPSDNAAINWFMAQDPNARILVISGAWAVPLFKSNAGFEAIRETAARLQKIENKMLHELRYRETRARVHIWTMAEFMEAPMEPLQMIVDEIGRKGTDPLPDWPVMKDLTNFGQFVQRLRNQGMHPHLVGDFPAEPARRAVTNRPRRPYVIKP